MCPLSWLDPDLWTKFLVWCWTCLFTMELPNDCEIVYDSLYQGWSWLVFLASYWTYPVTTNLTCSWRPLLLTSKELRLETDWDSTRCKAAVCLKNILRCFHYLTFSLSLLWGRLARWSKALWFWPARVRDMKCALFPHSAHLKIPG